jgi:hypothetical protein
MTPKIPPRESLFETMSARHRDYSSARNAWIAEMMKPTIEEVNALERALLLDCGVGEDPLTPEEKLALRRLKVKSDTGQCPAVPEKLAYLLEIEP